MNKLLEVKRVKSENKIGTIIYFVSKDNINVKRKLSINADGKEHYFEVIEVSTMGHELLYVKAVEVGYWCDRLDQQDDLDIRKLKGLNISIITDREKIKEISRQSLWC
jgi:hypothetical protein